MCEALVTCAQAANKRLINPPVVSWRVFGPKPDVICPTRREHGTLDAKKSGGLTAGLTKRNGGQRCAQIVW